MLRGVLHFMRSEVSVGKEAKMKALSTRLRPASVQAGVTPQAAEALVETLAAELGLRPRTIWRRMPQVPRC